MPHPGPIMTQRQVPWGTKLATLFVSESGLPCCQGRRPWLRHKLIEVLHRVTRRTKSSGANLTHPVALQLGGNSKGRHAYFAHHGKAKVSAKDMASASGAGSGEPR